MVRADRGEVWTRQAPVAGGKYWLVWGDRRARLYTVWIEDGVPVFSWERVPVTDLGDAWWCGPVVPPPLPKD